jgi:pimeloyl-ACP methyl ester carboxylesterase
VPVSKGFRFYIKRLLLGLLALLCLFFVVSWAWGFYLGIGVEERNPPPGRLVDIGGTRLHIDCSGDGSPTVILETGSNAWSTSWSKVQQELAKTMRVCSYDRGGVGWSDAGSLPRNYATQLTELSALLDVSGEAPPYIMAGWSYGGPLAWLYTARNPDKVVGLVMVDSGTFRYQNWIKETYPQLYSMSQMGPKIIGAIYKLGLAGTAVTLVSNGDAPNPLFASIQTNDVGFLVKSIPGILAEGGNMEASLRQLFNPIPEIGNIPLVVIESENVMPVPGMPALGQELKAQFHADQLDLLNYSDDSEYLVAPNSGHNIPDEAPQTVVDAVNRIRAKLED